MERLFKSGCPDGCNDLAVYLQHLENADRMMSLLKQSLTSADHGGWLCWYGDHVPIMPVVYDLFGEVQGHSHYYIWSSRSGPTTGPAKIPLHVHQLAGQLVRLTGAEWGHAGGG